MTPEELRSRTKQFAIDIIRLHKRLPKSEEARLIGRQLLRAGTSVGANYRAVCRFRSRADLIGKLGIVIEEADETAYWLEILVEAGIVGAAMIGALHVEAEALTRIFVSSRMTARRNARTDPQLPITNH